jgi:hypothetical protein
VIDDEEKPVRRGNDPGAVEQVVMRRMGNEHGIVSEPYHEGGMAGAKDPKYTAVLKRGRLAARQNGHAPLRHPH